MLAARTCSPRALPRRSALPGANTVFVHNLPWVLTDDELTMHMAAAGLVVKVDIMVGNNGRPMGCACVEQPETAHRGAGGGGGGGGRGGGGGGP